MTAPGGDDSCRTYPKQVTTETGRVNPDMQTGKLGEIVVFLNGRTDNSGILEFAATLAEEHEAHLIGIFMEPEPTIAPEATFARGTGMRAVVEEERAELEGIAASQRAVFEHIVSRHGIRSEWRVSPRFADDVGLHTHYADVAVIARTDSTNRTAGPPGLVEDLVLTSGRPIITLPPHGIPTGVRRIMVAWNARREAVRAVADALPLIARAEAVQVLIVNHELHPERYGPEPGADIARHLARHNAKVEVRRLSSAGEDVGRCLLSQATAFGADLVVMGAYGHSRLRGWVFGGVTRIVLREAGMPVLMSR